MSSSAPIVDGDLQLGARSLVVSFLVSLLLAIVALVSFVLPAEYGIDPLGLGERLGVKNMSGYTVNALSQETQAPHQDAVAFPLAPFESVEYKYKLAAGQAMVFSWRAQGDLVFDFHSEEKGKDPEDSVSFSVGRSPGEHGTFVAPFDGIHGWFWENRGDVDVVVQLETSGFYEVAKTYSPAGVHEKKFD